jgi:hypothetical protein
VILRWVYWKAKRFVIANNNQQTENNIFRKPIVGTQITKILHISRKMSKTVIAVGNKRKISKKFTVRNVKK